MASTELKQWLTQMAWAGRCSIKARYVRYKNNHQRLPAKRLKGIDSIAPSKLLKKKVIVNKDVSSISIPALQGLILQDIQSQNIIFEFCKPSHRVFLSKKSPQIADQVKLQKPLENELKFRSLFQNVVRDTYGSEVFPDFELIGDQVSRRAFFANTLQLAAIQKNGERRNISALWPSLDLSMGCRGIALSKTPQSENLSKVIHPITLQELPVFFAFDSQCTTGALSLFPSMVKEHAKYFERDLFTETVFPTRRCTAHEMATMLSIASNLQKGTPAKMSDYLTVSDLSTKASNSLIHTPRTVSQLLGALDKGSFRKTAPEGQRGKMCSTDILRGSVISNKVTDVGIKEEYCKISILYSIFRNSRRMAIRFQEVKAAEDANEFLAWDKAILEKLSELNGLAEPQSSDDMVVLKYKFDSFMKALNSYNCTIVAEARAYYADSSKPPSVRQKTMMRVLSYVVSENRWLPHIYPNLYDEINRGIPESLPTIEDIGFSGANKGQELFALCEILLGFEDTAIESTRREESKLKNIDERTQLNDFKLVVLTSNENFVPHEELLRATTKLPFQMVKDTQEVTRVSFSECIAKTSCAGDTIVYLYKTKRTSGARSKIDAILSDALHSTKSIEKMSI
ncbi:LAMI_0D13278g1_1 [Lachancea mirantina]|uniref:LAMI_0D13278g1_1 n=1 Tax=Lachancea mirantina TaxID=1230905 RepID=A0A1G4JGB2_9SACH|nr:LAMI_0D13278g1_1 [Lachancea mirantina]